MYKYSMERDKLTNLTNLTNYYRVEQLHKECNMGYLTATLLQIYRSKSRKNMNIH